MIHVMYFKAAFMRQTFTRCLQILNYILTNCFRVKKICDHSFIFFLSIKGIKEFGGNQEKGEEEKKTIILNVLNKQ